MRVTLADARSSARSRTAIALSRRNNLSEPSVSTWASPLKLRRTCPALQPVGELCVADTDILKLLACGTDIAVAFGVIREVLQASSRLLSCKKTPDIHNPADLGRSL